MGFIDDILAMDAAACASPDMMPGVESLIFNPAGGGAPVNFTGTVFRRQIQNVPGQNSGYTAPSVQVFVPAKKGITKITPGGGDTITVAVNIGDTPQKMPVTQIVSQDPGGWLLEVM